MQIHSTPAPAPEKTKAQVVAFAPLSVSGSNLRNWHEQPNGIVGSKRNKSPGR